MAVLGRGGGFILAHGLLLGLPLALCFLLAGLGGVPAGAARITNEPDGFNGYTWGSPSSQYPSLKHVTDPILGNPLPFVVVYENPGEVVMRNGVTFTKAVYRFSKDRLGNIQLWYEGKENREKLIRWIEEQYGKPPKAERSQKQIEWHGENVVITLDYDILTGKGGLWFTYLEYSPFDNSTTDTSGY
jgi:hypothetical protein